jgi:hypothetical protein
MKMVCRIFPRVNTEKNYGFPERHETTRHKQFSVEFYGRTALPNQEHSASSEVEFLCCTGTQSGRLFPFAQSNAYLSDLPR